MACKKFKEENEKLAFEKLAEQNLLEQPLDFESRPTTNIWNLIFGALGTIFLVWAIVGESLIKLIGAGIFFVLAALNSQ